MSRDARKGRMRRSVTMDRTKVYVIIVAVVAIALIITGALMVFNKSPDLLNSEFCVVVTNSMDGGPTEYEISTIPVNSLIAVHKLHGDDTKGIKVGDVIGFRSSLVAGNIYHRVIAIDEENHKFTTKGDNAYSTETVAFDSANGKVVNVSKEAGDVVVFVKQNQLFIIFALIMVVIIAEAVSYLLKIWK
jgi:hypothetical protein